jgi:hypothetical protein
MKLCLRLAFLIGLLSSTAAVAQVLGGPVIQPGGSNISLTTSGTSGPATLISGVLNIPNYGATSSGVTSLTGDGGFYSNSASTGVVTLTLSGAIGYSVWGNPSGSTATPGYTNSPEVLSLTTSGNLTVLGNASLAGTTTFSGALNATATATFSGPVVLTSAGTAKGFPFPEIQLRATTTDTTGDITPGNYTPAAGTNAFIGIPGYALAASVTGATVNLSLTAFLPHIIPQGTLYLRQRYLTPLAATATNTVKATVADAVVLNSSNPFTARAFQC